MDAQCLQLPYDLSFRHALAQVFQQQAHASVLRERESVKTHTLALSEGPQGVNSGPETVGSLGHQHKVLALHLGHKLARGLRGIPFQKAAMVLHPGNVHRGFVTPLHWGNDFLHLGARGVVLVGVPPIGPRHVTGCPGRGAPLCCFLRSNRYRRRASTLGCKLGRPTWLVECGGVRDQVSVSSCAHRDVLLPSRGDLVSGGVLRDYFTSLPSVPSPKAPFLVGSVAEESTPAFPPFSGRPVTTPAYTTLTSA
jgi:hypothetical protein